MPKSIKKVNGSTAGNGDRPDRLIAPIVQRLDVMEDQLARIKEVGNTRSSAPGVVYEFLIRHSDKRTGKSWYSVARIAETLDYSERTVERALRVLVKAKVIERTRRRRRTAVVTLLVPPEELGASLIRHGRRIKKLDQDATRMADQDESRPDTRVAVSRETVLNQRSKTTTNQKARAKDYQSNSSRSSFSSSRSTVTLDDRQAAQPKRKLQARKRSRPDTDGGSRINHANQTDVPRLTEQVRQSLWGYS